MFGNLFKALGRLALLVIVVIVAIKLAGGSGERKAQTTIDREAALSTMPPAVTASELTARAEANRMPMPDADTIKTQRREPVGAWRYAQRKDEMRGTTTKFASIVSGNSHSFAFPYSGGSKLEVTLRRTGGADEVMLEISKGQFTSCISHCTIAAKFDDGKVLTYTGSAAAAGRSDVIFINETSGFVRRIGQAKRLTLEPEFYREGRRQFSFEVSGLKWP